jgi:class 3 adenylate cyclase
LPDIKPSPEIEAVVRRWLAGSAERDTEATAASFSESSALCYIGSAPDEIWIDDVLRTVFAAMPGDHPTFTYENLQVSAFESGSFGWAFWTAILMSSDGSTRTDFRGTIILVIEKSAWRIVHSHNSNPVPNLQSIGHEPGLLEDLLTAVAKAKPRIEQTGMASIMFTDIAGGTALAEAMGDVRWANVVQRHVTRIAEAIEKQDGQLIKSLGDGTMSTFPSAGAGMRAAQAIQTALADDAQEPRLQVRIGLHTSDVVSAGDDFFGTVVNKAARIAGIARPGEIRVSEATRIMIGGASGFTFSDPATIPLKGLDGTHLVHLLDW